MPKLRVDREMLDGIEVEWLEVDAHEATNGFETDWSRFRKAAPLDKPLAATVVWCKTLASNIQPFALLEKYPRIANQIAASWHDPVALSAYFENLLIDRRGGRQGFPPDVQHDLLALNEHYYFGPRSRQSLSEAEVDQRDVWQLPRGRG